MPTLDELNLLAVLPLLVMGAWAVLLVVLDLFIPQEKKSRTAVLAIIALISSGVVLGLQAAGLIPNEGPVAFDGLAVADGFALFLQATFLLTTLFGILVAINYLPRRGIERGEYYTLLLFTTTGMMLMALANDLIVVFLSLELLSIPLYILSGFDRENPKSEEAALKYFLLGAFSSAFFVFGIALTYGGTMSTSLQGIVDALGGNAPSPGLAYAGMALLLVGLGFKVAAAPFHMWTPDVYEGAPTSATAFMSVGAKAGGFAAMIRVMVVAFGTSEIAPHWGTLIAILAIITMIIGNVIAIPQDDIKRMLGYSSIAHAGYILMALAAASVTEANIPLAEGGLLSVTAPAAAAFYLLTYTFTNLGAFAVVIAIEKDDGSGTRYEDFEGLGQTHPVLAFIMVIFMLSLTGIPLTAGFVGKFFVFQSAVAVAGTNPIFFVMIIVAALTTAVSAYYYVRVIIAMYLREGDSSATTQPVLKGALALTAAATVLLGILPALVVRFAEGATIAAIIGG